MTTSGGYCVSADHAGDAPRRPGERRRSVGKVAGPWWAWLLLALGLGLGCALAGAEPRQLTVLHFNDFHGQLSPEQDGAGGPTRGGIARLRNLVRGIRAEAPPRPVLLLFAGDLLQGSLLSSLFRGLPDVELFNAMGVDAAVLGNHELDFGQENLRRLIAAASFPVLGANVDMPWRSPPIPVSVLLEPGDGLRVAVLGLTTGQLITATHPRNTDGVVVRDPISSAARHVPELEQAADLLIVLSHLGLAQDLRLAAAIGGVDLIVGGHDHFALAAPREVHGTLILQAGARGRFLGRMDLEMDEGQVRFLGYRLIPVDDGFPEDPEFQARVAALEAQVDAGLDRVVGRTAVFLDARRETIRQRESNLGSFVADLAKEVSGAEVALVNGGAFRESIPAGPVTGRQIQRLFPFDNELVTGLISGSELLQALERSAGFPPGARAGGFLQVSGLRFSIDGDRPVGMTVGGQPLDPHRLYRLVAPDFLTTGGDGYAVLTGLRDPVATGHRLADLLAEALRGQAEIRPATDGRIRRLPD